MKPLRTPFVPGSATKQRVSRQGATLPLDTRVAALPGAIGFR